MKLALFGFCIGVFPWLVAGVVWWATRPGEGAPMDDDPLVDRFRRVDGL